MTCSAPNCGERTYCRGLCAGHYKRLQQGRPLETPIARRQSDPLARLKHYAWRWAHATELGFSPAGIEAAEVGMKRAALAFQKHNRRTA